MSVCVIHRYKMNKSWSPAEGEDDFSKFKKEAIEFLISLDQLWLVQISELTQSKNTDEPNECFYC